MTTLQNEFNEQEENLGGTTNLSLEQLQNEGGIADPEDEQPDDQDLIDDEDGSLDDEGIEDNDGSEQDLDDDELDEDLEGDELEEEGLSSDELYDGSNENPTNHS